MATYPEPSKSLSRLKQAGWLVSEGVGYTAAGRFWLVVGTNGENVIRAEGRTQAEAWWRACQQAEAVGMIGRADRGS